MEVRGRGRQREPKDLASVSPSRPPVLPVNLEVLATIYQYASGPKRSFELALRGHGSFCKRAAGRQPRMR